MWVFGVFLLEVFVYFLLVFECVVFFFFGEGMFCVDFVEGNGCECGGFDYGVWCFVVVEDDV